MLKVCKIILLIAILNGGIAHGFFAPLTSLLFGDEGMMPGVEDLLINKNQVSNLPYDFENTIGGSQLGAQISRRLNRIAADNSDLQRESLLKSLDTPLMLASRTLRPAFLEKEKENEDERMTQMSQDETTSNNEMKPVDNEQLLKDFEEAHKQLDKIKDKMLRTFDAVKMGRPAGGEEQQPKSENIITLKNNPLRKLTSTEEENNDSGKNGLWMLRKRKEKIIPLFSMRINTMDNKVDPMGLMDKLISAVTMGNDEPLTGMQMMTAVQQPMQTEASQTDGNGMMTKMQMSPMMPPMGDMQMQMPAMQMMMPNMQMPAMQMKMPAMQMQMPNMQMQMPPMQMQMPSMQAPMPTMQMQMPSTDMNTMQLHTIGGLSCDLIHSKSDMGNQQNKIRLQHGMMSRITYRYESSTCTCGKMMTQSQMCSHAYSRPDEQMCSEREMTEQPKSNCDALEMCKQNANCDGIHFNGAKYTMLECQQKNKQVATKPGLAADYVIQMSNCF